MGVAMLPLLDGHAIVDLMAVDSSGAVLSRMTASIPRGFADEDTVVRGAVAAAAASGALHPDAQLPSDKHFAEVGERG